MTKLARGIRRGAQLSLLFCREHDAVISTDHQSFFFAGAASIRRLVRDGVDEPLAKLFVHVARGVEPEAEGIQRARSASEAFLFRRLESLAETTGRFRMNAELPIAFDGWGKTEVDLLDEETRLVIELDGGQHFANEDAYRRDRRKDALLQQHGYFVLQFLVQDIGVKLDHVLDTILRVLTQLRRHTGRQ